MRGRRLRLAMLAGALVLFFARSSPANGRFPQASQLVVDPLDASHVVVRTTFGPLQSTDSGATFRWICERSVGYSGTFDPALAIAEGGILFGLFDGVSRSADRACGFARSTGAIEGLYVADLTVDPNEAKHVLAVTAPTSVGTPGYRAVFAESNDGGRSFAIPGDRLPEDFAPSTLEIAPSRRERIYVSGKGAFPLFGVFERSDDGGRTWTETTFDMHGAVEPFISAVDPKNDARVFVRLAAETSDRLVVSRDSARTFDDVLVGKGRLLGFALSPDGTRLAVGGPLDGIQVADATTLAFSKTSAAEVYCLTWSKSGLYACARNDRDALVVERSIDEGKSFDSTAHSSDLKPLACAAGTTTGDKCEAEWPGVRDALGIDDAGPKDSGPDIGSDATVDATTDDVGPNGGIARDVGCTLVRSPGGRSWSLLATLVAALVAGRRRARRTILRALLRTVDEIRAR